MLLSTSSGTGRGCSWSGCVLSTPGICRVEPRVLSCGRLILPRPFNSAVRPAETPLVGMAAGRCPKALEVAAQPGQRWPGSTARAGAASAACVDAAGWGGFVLGGNFSEPAPRFLFEREAEMKRWGIYYFVAVRRCELRASCSQHIRA